MENISIARHHHSMVGWEIIKTFAQVRDLSQKQLDTVTGDSVGNVESFFNEITFAPDSDYKIKAEPPAKNKGSRIYQDSPNASHI